MTINWRIGNTNKRGDVLIVGPGLTLSEDVDGHPKLSTGDTDGGGAHPFQPDPIALSEDVSFHASGSAGFHIKQTPVTIADISPDGTHAFDATGYREVRLIGEIKIPGPTGCRIALQYSTDEGTTWGYLEGIGGPSFDISIKAGPFRTSWVAVETGAQQDLDLRIVLIGGDGASPARFGKVVSAQFRTKVQSMNLVAPPVTEPNVPCDGVGDTGSASKLPVGTGLQAWHVLGCGIGGEENVPCNATVDFDDYATTADMEADGWACFGQGADIALDSDGGPDGRACLLVNISPVDVYSFLPSGLRDVPRVTKTISGLTPGVPYNLSVQVNFSVDFTEETEYIRQPGATVALTDNSFSSEHNVVYSSAESGYWVWGTAHYGSGSPGDPEPFSGKWAERWWTNFGVNPRLHIAFEADSNGDAHFIFHYGGIWGPTGSHTIRFADIKITADSELVCRSGAATSTNPGSGMGSWADQSGNNNDLKVKACEDDTTDGGGPDGGGTVDPKPGGTIPIDPIGRRMYGLYHVGQEGDPWPDVFDHGIQAAGGWTEDVLTQCRTKKRRLIISIGGRHKFQNSSGNYDPRLYDAYVRDLSRFESVWKSFWDDGTLYGIIMADDIRQGASRSWPPSGLSNSEINRMCGVWKQFFHWGSTGIRTICRAAPDILAGQSTKMPNLDVSVAQYSVRYGSVANYIEKQYAARAKLGIPHILWSINVTNGGDGSSGLSGSIDGDASRTGYSVSPAEYIKYGTAFARLTDSEGLTGWKYDARTFSQNGIIDACITVRNILVAVPEQ